MAPVAKPPPFEIPRFLLPRLTWTSTGPTFTKIVPSSKSIARRPRSPSQQLQRAAYSTSRIQRHAAATPIALRPRSSTAIVPRGPLSRFTARKATPQSRSRSLTTVPSPTSSPLRHNGPYALLYRPARLAFSPSPSTSASFSTSTPQSKEHHFDTLKFVSRLKSEGLSTPQSVALMSVLNSVIEESIQNLTRTMVLKEDAERSTYTQKVDFAKLRSELASADSTEAQLTRSGHERLTSDLAKLSSRLKDEISRTQASVRLDLSLEKGRIREEANGQEMRIKETEARIEQEVAGLRERVEQVKFSTVQWLMGVCTGTAALILGAWRLLM